MAQTHPSLSAADAQRAVAANPVWYHTIELAPGVLTPGRVDLRAVAAKILPNDMRGLRALDVGTFDGFWAFELERRGAQVVAIDIDSVGDAQLPGPNREMIERTSDEFGIELGRGFALAAEALGSSVTRVVCDVLGLSAEAIHGPVDIAFIGALLVHLRDPVSALERVRDVLVPGGRLFQLEAISPRLTLRHPRSPVAEYQPLFTPFNWWHPNRQALKAWLLTAGFEQVEGLGVHRPPQLPPMRDWYWGVRSRRPGEAPAR